MKINDNLHEAQIAILHVLLFRPSASFSELQKASELASDHFNFHLKKMIEQEVIHKTASGHYELTVSGKEYANRFDTDEKKVERQPKICVLLRIHRDDGRMVCQQRLKQPYYGFWGRPTGKVRWGETILEAASRELMEETGLEAELALTEIHHKTDFDKTTGKLLEDKIFFMVQGVKPRGDLIEMFDGGRNAWMNQEEIQRQELVFDGMQHGVEPQSLQNGIVFTEKQYYYEPKDY